MSDPNSDHTSIHPHFWILGAHYSGIVAFTFYPMSSSFRAVFGEIKYDLFNLDIKFILCYSVPFITAISIKLGIVSSRYANRIGHAANFGCLVLILTSVYTVLEDKGKTAESETGYARTMDLVSSAAFTLMSKSVSKLIKFPHEVGLTKFFLGCLIVQMLKMNMFLWLACGVVCWRIWVLLRPFLPHHLCASMVDSLNATCNGLVKINVALIWFYYIQTFIILPVVCLAIKHSSFYHEGLVKVDLTLFWLYYAGIFVILAGVVLTTIVELIFAGVFSARRSSPAEIRVQ